MQQYGCVKSGHLSALQSQQLEAVVLTAVLLKLQETLGGQGKFSSASELVSLHREVICSVSSQVFCILPRGTASEQQPLMKLRVTINAAAHGLCCYKGCQRLAQQPSETHLNTDKANLTSLKQDRAKIKPRGNGRKEQEIRRGHKIVI